MSSLRNDVLQALEQHDARRAHAIWQTLQQEYAQDDSLAALLALTEAVQARARQVLQPALLADHPALRRTRLALRDTIEPAALSLMGLPMECGKQGQDQCALQPDRSQITPPPIDNQLILFDF